MRMFGAASPSIMMFSTAGEPRLHGAFRRGQDFARIGDELAVAAEPLGDLVVARRQQLGCDDSVAAILPQLDLVLGVPTRVVAHDRDEGKSVAHRRIHLRRMKAERAVTHHGDDRCAGPGQARREGERKRGADRARNAIDDAMGRAEARLCPLPDLPAVRDEDRVGMGIEQRLQRTQRLHRVHAPGLARRGARPFGRTIGDRVADFAHPCTAGRPCGATCQCLRGEAGLGNPRRDRASRPHCAACDRVLPPPHPLAGTRSRNRWPARCRTSRVKSSRLPSSRMQSARARGWANAPRPGSAMPRGLSMQTTGIPLASSNAAARALPSRVQNEGPARIKGRFALARRTSRRAGIRIGETLFGDVEVPWTYAPACLLRLQGIHRQAEMHRAATPRARDAYGLGKIGCEGLRATIRPRSLADRRRHLGLRHLLELAAAHVARCRMAREEDHRRLGHARGVERRHRVGMPRPARDESHAHLTGEPCPRIRHVHGRGLVTHVDQLEAPIERGIEHRHDVVAREREDPLHTRARDAFCQRIGHWLGQVAIWRRGRSVTPERRRIDAPAPSRRIL